MNKKQYLNIIKGSLKQCTLSNVTDNIEKIKAIFKNMGVAFPQGDHNTIIDALSSDDYMGWKKCSPMEAVKYLSEGIPSIGVSETSVVLFTDDSDSVPVADAKSVAILNADTRISELEGLTLYAYTNTSTTQKPFMTTVEYYSKIMSTDLKLPTYDSSGNKTTYCNQYVQAVLTSCNIPHPKGKCKTMLAEFDNGYDKWVEIKPNDFADAQQKANNGYAVVAISEKHAAMVAPNNIKYVINGSGSVPASIGKVNTSQSGSKCFYDRSLDNGWSGSTALSEVRFFYYKAYKT